MTEPTIFSLAEAQRARDEGIEAADEAAPRTWRERALDAVLALALGQTSFTVDDVWILLESWEVPPPPEKRAMAGVLSEAVRSDWIVRSGRFVPSTQRHCHANPRMVWRSRITNQEPTL